MKYKYAELLAAMAERAKVSDTFWDVIQWQDSRGNWHDCTKFPVFEREALRVKPRTIRIGNREVSEPLRIEDLDKVKVVYYPSFQCAAMVDCVHSHTEYAQNLIERGIAHGTEAEARELAEALLEVL